MLNYYLFGFYAGLGALFVPWLLAVAVRLGLDIFNL